MDFRDTILWGKLVDKNGIDTEASERLKGAYLQFREKASALTGLISKTLPELTIHDISHLDGLWCTASLLITEDYKMNPLEVFIFGCAVLLHDSALCEEAFDGLERLRDSVEWKDAHALATKANPTASPSDIEKDCDFTAIRRLHANQAAVLATKEWPTGDGGGKLFLLADDGLRNHYGQLLGNIASSHHWNIDRVASEYSIQVNVIAGFPASWVIDPMKIAALLRCADALHTDQNRAPDFLHALIKKSGLSAKHWQAQNWLAQPTIDSNDSTRQTLAFTSSREFPEQNSEDWWIAYDAISIANREIQTSNDMLENSKNDDTQAFDIKKIAGADSPTLLSNYVRVSGWSPVSAEIHVSNIASLVESLGGQNLYGVTDFPGKLVIVMRELLQNSADAIKARKAIDGEFKGQVFVSMCASGDGINLSISDNGVGMSELVLTGPFLDFSSSFWFTNLVNDEFPGLLSSGYKSSGRFGVGFYSSFMVADSIEVKSRRYDAGLAETRTLKFENGVSLRPKLLVGDADGTMARTTSVSLKLNDDQFAKNPEFAFQSNTENTDPYKIPIYDAVALLVSALNEPVSIQIDDAAELLIHAGLPVSMEEKAAWLSIHLGQKHEKTLDDSQFETVVNHLRYFDDDQPQLGLAALNPFMQDRTGGGVKTVGGLRPTIAGGGREFFGFIDCEPASAKRNPGDRVASADAVSSWMAEQLNLIQGMQLERIHWHFISSRLGVFDVDPSPYLVMPIQFGDNFMFLDLNTIGQILNTQSMVVHVDQRINRVNFDPEIEIPGSFPRLQPFCGAWAMLSEDYAMDDHKFCFLACLDRQLATNGRKLVITKTPTGKTSRQFNLPVDLYHLSSKEI